eukprot:snap_masked-scaffold_6-processed-gene-18.29-mRNA-1 protein AED:1.00 eAED:1.00 QI:0/-1/0/0/-1/1/1/0/236
MSLKKDRDKSNILEEDKKVLLSERLEKLLKQKMNICVLSNLQILSYKCFGKISYLVQPNEDGVHKMSCYLALSLLRTNKLVLFSQENSRKPDTSATLFSSLLEHSPIELSFAEANERLCTLPQFRHKQFEVFFELFLNDYVLFQGKQDVKRIDFYGSRPSRIFSSEMRKAPSLLVKICQDEIDLSQIAETITEARKKNEDVSFVCAHCHPCKNLLIELNPIDPNDLDVNVTYKIKD